MTTPRVFLIFACLIGCGGDDATTPPPSTALSARIERTSFGVPHITAATERDLGFGVGTVMFDDAVCTLADAIVTVRGERSLHFGADGVYEPSGDGRVVGNLASDVYYRFHADDAKVAATWQAQPPAIQDLLEGFVRGYDARLAARGADGLPEPCRGQPWVTTITAQDLVRLMRRYAVEGSGAQFIQGIAGATPPAPGSTVAPRQAPTPADFRRFRPSEGSNGVALGRDATTSGAGLLLANPHFPWSGLFRFRQLHITIPGVVDATGATLLGLPAVGIGHNQDVAWTHTVNSSWHFAFTALALDPADPTRYVVDGETRAMEARTIEVPVRGADGAPTTVTRTVWLSDAGPIVVVPGLLEWSGATAFALGDANAENGRLLEVWWAIDRAGSLAALRDAVESTLGIPWVNTIAVDAGGTTYLGDVTPVPRVDASCVPEPFQGLAAGGLTILDGSRAACVWHELTPAAELPTLQRTDFVQNSNDSAWLTNPAAPLTGFAPIVSLDGQPAGPRTRLGLAQLAAALADGGTLDADGLLAMAFSNRAFHATTLLPDLLALCADAPELAAPCAVLAGWDGTAELASRGWPLFRAWRRALEQGAADAELDVWTVPFDPADPVGTPRGLRTIDPAIATLAREALTSAAATLADAGIDPALPWGQLQHVGAIPIHGGGGDFFNDGGDEIYNTINARPGPDGTLEPYYGSTFVLAVDFTGGAPHARGVLTTSPDQLERFSDKAWIDFPFTADEIATDPALVTEDVREP